MSENPEGTPPANPPTPPPAPPAPPAPEPPKTPVTVQHGLDAQSVLDAIKGIPEAVAKAVTELTQTSEPPAPPANQPPANQPPANQPPANQPPASKRTSFGEWWFKGGKS